jgi:phosphatidate cytidylyltransferase
MIGPTYGLIGVVILLLTAATAVGRLLTRQTEWGLNPAAVEAFNSRLRAWWLICFMLAWAFVFPHGTTVALFGGLSFWALREFITLTPTRLGDHGTLLWVFFLFTPLQFVLVAFDDPSSSRSTYPLYSIMIPVYAFLFIPAKAAFVGDPRRFLERVAKIQCGLLICVYCLSYAPALLYLNLSDYDTERLLFFFVAMVLLSDAMQFAWGKLYGRHPIAPEINESRTWEGLLGSAATTALVGGVLWWATPFGAAWQSGLMSLLIAVMGFAGGMTMSAIKRDRGVKDYGTLVEGHGGVLDRIDSVCFAAPVFYHVTRYFFV